MKNIVNIAFLAILGLLFFSIIAQGAERIPVGEDLEQQVKEICQASNFTVGKIKPVYRDIGVDEIVAVELKAYQYSDKRKVVAAFWGIADAKKVRSTISQIGKLQKQRCWAITVNLTEMSFVGMQNKTMFMSDNGKEFYFITFLPAVKLTGAGSDWHKLLLAEYNIDRWSIDENRPLQQKLPGWTVYEAREKGVSVLFETPMMPLEKVTQVTINDFNAYLVQQNVTARL